MTGAQNVEKFRLDSFDSKTSATSYDPKYSSNANIKEEYRLLRN